MSGHLQRLRDVCCPDCVDGDSCGDCQAIHDAATEIERLQRAEATFHEEYRQRCDVETKALHIEIERLRAERDDLLSDIQLMASPHESVGHIVLEYRRQRDEARALLREVTTAYRAGHAVSRECEARLDAMLGGRDDGDL